VSYATQQDLVERFGSEELVELTNRGGGGAADSVVIERALADADDTINGYLSSRYTLPLATVPLLLKRMAGDIARYLLYEDRVTDQVERRYSDAIAWLKDVASGKASLGADAVGAQPASDGGAQASGGDRVFTRGTSGEAGTLDDYAL
jgi:phage gp36-like protein